MIYAVKGNKQLKIDEAEKATYLKLGYDIGVVSGDKLEITTRSPNSTVPYAKYEVLENKLADAQAELSKAKSDLTKAEAKILEYEKPKEDSKEVKETKAKK